MLACSLNPGKGDTDPPVRMAQMLLEYGADTKIKCTGDDGIFAFHYVARERSPKILRTFSDACIDLGELDRLGSTAMHQFALGYESYSSSISFDSKRNCIPGTATEYLAILIQNCG
ncbi:ankyrin repeat-containing protein [Colletotrichum graminicola]|nr:ankyrin repeat-containing protein [Colletotrichum graminicola]